MAPRVRLVPVAVADQAEFLAAVARSRQLHGSWVAPPATPEAFRAMVKRSQAPASLTCVVRRADTGELAGYINISNIVRGLFQSAYLGYYAFAGHERQGLMRAGLQLAIRTAFRDLKLHRLEANIQPQNRGSIALVQACGFAKEGFSPRYLKIARRWRDHERWAILAR
ncbi:MAG: GNAT family N-acetyltransferase [Ramlibacter sp.]